MATQVFEAPSLDHDELAVIAIIDELRHKMRNRIDDSPRRWSGGLRRMLEARAVQGSNTIEGYDASLDDVLAVMDGEPPLDADTATRLALEGYQEAMTYVLQASKDDNSNLDEGLLKALHFMMVKHDLSTHPGRWRPGTIFVHDEERDLQVYEGPPAAELPQLIDGMLRELSFSEAMSMPVLVRSAMAHLNLVMIHPFKDGNGRMARCIQTFILARER